MEYETSLTDKTANRIKSVVSGRFLIRIKKAKKSSYWYSKKNENAIGKEFKVKQDDKSRFNWEIVDKGKYILKSDVVVLKTLR